MESSNPFDTDDTSSPSSSSASPAADKRIKSVAEEASPVRKNNIKRVEEAESKQSHPHQQSKEKLAERKEEEEAQEDESKAEEDEKLKNRMNAIEREKQLKLKNDPSSASTSSSSQPSAFSATASSLTNELKLNSTLTKPSSTESVVDQDVSSSSASISCTEAGSSSSSTPPTTSTPTSSSSSLAAVHESTINASFETISSCFLQIETLSLQHAQSLDKQRRQEEEEQKQRVIQLHRERETLQESIRQLQSASTSALVLPELLREKQELSSSNASLDAQCTTASSALKTSQQQEAHYMHVLTQRSSSSAADISLLPLSVLLTSVLGFLRLKEVINLLQVCHRWHFYFDRISTASSSSVSSSSSSTTTVACTHSALWRRTLHIVISRLLQQRDHDAKLDAELAASSSAASASASASETLVTHPPVTLNLLLNLSQLVPRPKSTTLTKADACKYFTSQLQNQFSVVMKDFESASTSQQEISEKKHALKEKLAFDRDARGRKRVLMGSMDEMARVLMKEREKLAKEIKQKEQEIRAEGVQRDTLKAAHQVIAKANEKRLQRVKEMEEFLNDTDANGGKTRRQQVEELRAEKKALQAEIDQAKNAVAISQAQKQQADAQIAALRNKVRNVGW